MGKTSLEFEYEGVEYTLCYTIDSLKKLEKSGFSFGNIEDHIVSAPEELFYAAFNAKHAYVPTAKRKEIYKALSPNVEGTEDTLTEILLAMVTEVIENMQPQGNVKWKVTKG